MIRHRTIFSKLNQNTHCFQDARNAGDLNSFVENHQKALFANNSTTACRNVMVPFNVLKKKFANKKLSSNLPRHCSSC